MVGEQLTTLIVLFIGMVIGISMSIIVMRRRTLVFPLIPTLITVLSTTIAIDGLIERDLTVFFIGAILALFGIYPLLWKANNIALRIIYSILLITIPILFITIAGIGIILRLTGILALVGMAVGIANIIMLTKH